jgi:transcriptional regulator with XRE-family HTH domain
MPCPSKFLSLSAKLRRIEAGLYQRRVAQELHKSNTWLSRRERGHLPISERDARALARILKVPVSALFGEGDR